MDLTKDLDRPVAINPAGGYLTGREFMALSEGKQEEIVTQMEDLLKQAMVRPKKRSALRDGQFSEVDEEEIDYEFDSPNQWFGSHTNLIPLQSAVAGPRVFYGARFANQAMPITNREIPLVQAAIDNDPDGRSFDDYYGAKMGSLKADTDGEVLNVTPDEIELKLPDGKKRKLGLYRDFPLNRKSAITSTPLVKPGDIIKPGQLLADSNYTKNGTLAMGVNARVGLVPYLGHSMDDAIVISDKFAKRLTQQGMFSFDTDYKRGTKGGKAHFSGLFPQKYIMDQLKKLDDDGVIKEGELVHPGDPLILATRPKVISSTTAQLGKLSSHMRNARHDASTVWDHEEPGRVVDVKKLRNGVRINVVADQPTKPGDKIVFRSGQKGTVSLILPDEHMPRTVDGTPLEVLLNPQGVPCYDDKTEFLTDEGWLPAEMVTARHRVATLNRKTFCMEFQLPEAVFHLPYTGKMYRFVCQQLDMLVTPNHKLFLALRKMPKIYRKFDFKDSAFRPLFQLYTPDQIFGKACRYLKAAQWQGHSQKFYEIPAGSRGRTSKPTAGYRFSAEQWAEFMGWFIAEGSTHIARTKRGKDYRLEISQSKAANPEKYERICQLLTQMGFRYFYKHARGLRLSHKGLYEKLSVLGGSRKKYVPREIMDMSQEHLRIFLDALLKGDGNCYSNSSTRHVECLSYTTASKKLADDIQEICAKLGIAANIKRESRRGDLACFCISLQKDAPTTWSRWDKNKENLRQEEWVDYSGNVHCVTVPNGVLFVRRNGKAVFSGNSRVNNSIIYELLLGKVAKKRGQPYKLPTFNKAAEKWYEFVEQELKTHGVKDTEEVFDPKLNRRLERPITVGDAYVLKLHHTSASKFSVRGQGSYDLNDQPARGSGEMAQSKKLGGLEAHSLLSSGAYNVLREVSTLRGQRNDEYWRMLRQGNDPKEPGVPFVWNKFKALLTGAGFQARKLPGGVERLGFWTDKDLDRLDPIEVRKSDLVDLKTLSPVPGGLFDNALTGANSWGYVKLPHPVPNPAAEDVVRKLLGLTEKQFRSILAGDEEIPMHLLLGKRST